MITIIQAIVAFLLTHSAPKHHESSKATIEEYSSKESAKNADVEKASQASPLDFIAKPPPPLLFTTREFPATDINPPTEP